MITFSQNCYSVSISDDGANSHVMAYFTHASDAKKAAKGKSWWGTDGNVVPTTLSINIYESIDEYNGNTNEAEKEAALSKLSDREKKLLNLI